jgi:hypothetical protein
MPKSTQKSTKSASETQKVDVSTLFVTVEQLMNSVKTNFVSTVPEELPNENSEINKFFESAKDVYVELSRIRESAGTSLRDVGEVMRRLALHRSKANASVDVKLDTTEDDLVGENNDSEDEKDHVEEEKPKDKYLTEQCFLIIKK